MKAEILFNFISPVTGRVLADENYVLYGDKKGIATPSPIIIDIRLDLLQLRKEYDELKKDYEFSSSATFVLNTPNEKLPNAQALNQLVGEFPRILKANTDGIVEVAIKDIDYPTTARLVRLAKEAHDSEVAAADSASAASSSKNIAGARAAQAVDAAADAGKSASEAASSALGAGEAAAKALGAIEEIIGIAAVAAGSLTGAALSATIAEKAAHDAAVAANIIKKTGMRTIPGITGAAGAPGAAGAAGISTLLIDSNIDLNGARIENISQSPASDYDAISAKFAWNLINDNVEIIWQKRDQ